MTTKADNIMKTKRTWLNQFGLSYDVPDEILNNPLLMDDSWSQDACPKFILSADAGKALESIPILWVEHPRSYLREMVSEFRFVVTVDDEKKAETNDVKTAINAMVQASTKTA